MFVNKRLGQLKGITMKLIFLIQIISAIAMLPEGGIPDAGEIAAEQRRQTEIATEQRVADLLVIPKLLKLRITIH